MAGDVRWLVRPSLRSLAARISLPDGDEGAGRAASPTAAASAVAAAAASATPALSRHQTAPPKRFAEWASDEWMYCINVDDIGKDAERKKEQRAKLAALAVARRARDAQLLRRRTVGGAAWWRYRNSSDSRRSSSSSSASSSSSSSDSDSSALASTTGTSTDRDTLGGTVRSASRPDVTPRAGPAASSSSATPQVGGSQQTKKILRALDAALLQLLLQEEMECRVAVIGVEPAMRSRLRRAAAMAFPAAAQCSVEAEEARERDGVLRDMLADVDRLRVRGVTGAAGAARRGTVAAEHRMRTRCRLYQAALGTRSRVSTAAARTRALLASFLPSVLTLLQEERREWRRIWMQTGRSLVRKRIAARCKSKGAVRHHAAPLTPHRGPLLSPAPSDGFQLTRVDQPRLRLTAADRASPPTCILSSQALWTPVTRSSSATAGTAREEMSARCAVAAAERRVRSAMRKLERLRVAEAAVDGGRGGSRESLAVACRAADRAVLSLQKEADGLTSEEPRDAAPAAAPVLEPPPPASASPLREAWARRRRRHGPRRKKTLEQVMVAAGVPGWQLRGERPPRVRGDEIVASNDAAPFLPVSIVRLLRARVRTPGPDVPSPPRPVETKRRRPQSAGVRRSPIHPALPVEG
eukprot:TRINITY_DN16982_c0_g1_i1.p1 TRINITY_DN16982_c0_g1~~TRINITY_DN16982_c0_g1_i1.p1  ORF type:complete len:653 (+),score=186.22 TRINITY_DN16982_c0_g1_i1:44-1960(+)